MMRSTFLARNGQYDPQVRKFPKNLEDTSKLSAPSSVTRTKFHSQYAQMLGANVQNLVARNFFHSRYDLFRCRHNS